MKGRGLILLFKNNFHNQVRNLKNMDSFSIYYIKIVLIIIFTSIYIIFIINAILEVKEQNRKTYLRLNSLIGGVYAQFLEHEKNVLELENPKIIEVAQNIHRSEMMESKSIADINILNTYDDYLKKKQLDLERLRKKLPATEKPEDLYIFQILTGRKPQPKKLSAAEEKRKNLLKYKIDLIQNVLTKNKYIGKKIKKL